MNQLEEMMQDEQMQFECAYHNYLMKKKILNTEDQIIVTLKQQTLRQILRQTKIIKKECVELLA